MEWNTVTLQSAQSLHRRTVRTSPRSSLAMRIMDVGGAIYAQPNRHIVIVNESAPLFIDQSPVGLHTVADHRSCRRFPPNLVKRLLVIRDRHRQRLSGMPDHGERAQN